MIDTSEALGIAPGELDAELATLVEHGIVKIHEDHIHVLPLSAVIGQSITPGGRPPRTARTTGCSTSPRPCSS